MGIIGLSANKHHEYSRFFNFKLRYFFYSCPNNLFANIEAKLDTVRLSKGQLQDMIFLGKFISTFARKLANKHIAPILFVNVRAKLALFVVVRWK